MNKNKFLFDIILLFGLTAITFLSIAPKSFVMPSSVQMVILGIVVGLIATFMVFLWKENPRDEREFENQVSASRLAYLAGCLTLISFLIYQSITHSVDPGVPITLLVMIATKIIVQRVKDNN
jgi:ABC-type xylose transport system permease subunit